jgi:hypothetical protein
MLGIRATAQRAPGRKAKALSWFDLFLDDCALAAPRRQQGKQT